MIKGRNALVTGSTSGIGLTAHTSHRASAAGTAICLIVAISSAG